MAITTVTTRFAACVAGLAFLLPNAVHWSLAAQEAPVTLTPVARIGCDFCEGPEQFGRISSLGVRGELVVVGDRDAPHLRVFDFQGALVSAFGESGEGPGELAFPMAVRAAEDEVTTVDMGRQRVLRIGFDGVERASAATPPGACSTSSPRKETWRGKW